MAHQILGTRVDSTSYADASRLILNWARNGESRYVCIANVHMVMEAYDSKPFRQQVNAADLVTPDGMPLVWSLRRAGHRMQGRVYGPDLMLKVIDQAAIKKVPIGLLGGRPEILNELATRLGRWFPDLDVRYRFSPPFREPTPDEDQRMVNDINASGALILFVGLGCPRQEIWMAEHAGRVRSVMVGVGAAFDFHAGAVRQAPRWMQRIGLEWVFRLTQEPRRLWRRYLYHNPRFLWAQLVGSK
ncbi:MAG TPA: WecB/TagA/CpsF family glycosyltransferase [Gemmatimonadaceae bacterium]|nr:WecB/TagA/CpsF family glycosyltransferase [Gemmatimonadaceae bacterium]